jgi:hypothetical protein
MGLSEDTSMMSGMAVLEQMVGNHTMYGMGNEATVLSNAERFVW